MLIAFPKRPALDAAIARIEREFGSPSRGLKYRVRFVLRRGIHRPEIQARYKTRAQELCEYTRINSAIRRTESRLREERKLFAIASEFGVGARFSIVILEEVLLILRWLRFTGRGALYIWIISALVESQPIGQFEAVAERRYG